VGQNKDKCGGYEERNEAAKEQDADKPEPSKIKL
jgi:hypothetical protein